MQRRIAMNQQSETHVAAPQEAERLRARIEEAFSRGSLAQALILSREMDALQLRRIPKTADARRAAG